MQKLWAWLAINLGKRVGVVAVVGVVVTVVLGAGISRLEFATGQDSYLNTDEDIYIDNVAYQDLFGGQAMLTLFTMDEGSTVVDLFTSENLAQLSEIEEALAGEDGVLSVVTPRTALEFTQSIVTTTPSGELTDDPTTSVAGIALLGARDREPDAAAQTVRLDDAVATLARLNEVPTDQRTFENRAWVEFLLFDNRGEIRKALRPFFPDEGHAQLVTRLTGNADIEEEGAASDAVVAAIQGRDFDNATTLTTGAPVLLKDINDYLRGGFLTLGGIAVVLMVLILAATFRVRWRLLSLGVVLIGVIWAFGLAGYLGIPLSVVTISGLPVLLGIGIDFAIQIHSRVEEEVQLDRAAHPIQETTTNLIPPLIIATLAAAVSFLALLLARVPMIREFGVLLAIGILVVLVADVLITTAVLGAREYRAPTPPRNYTTDAIANGIVKLGSLPRKAVPAIALGSLVVFIGGGIVDPLLDLQTDPEEWVDQDSDVIADLDVLRAEVGSSSELGIYVQSDEVFSDETVGFVHDFATSSLAEQDLLLTASSIVTTVSFLIEIPGTTVLPPTGADVANLRRRPRRHPSVDGVARPGRPQPHLPHRVRTPRGPGCGRERDPRHRRAAVGRAGHPVGPRRRRRGPPREPRSEPGASHVRRAGRRVRVPAPQAAQPDRGGAVHDPRADGRGRHLSGGLRRRLQAQPAHGPRWTAGDRSMHGVHLAHPDPSPRGAPARPHPAEGGRGRGGSHRPGLRRLRAGHHRRRRCAGGLSPPAVARLRPDHLDQRGRRPALGAGDPATADGLGG